jgi:hypothetical protein
MLPHELQEPAEATAKVTLREMMESLGVALGLVVLVFGTVVLLLTALLPH